MLINYVHRIYVLLDIEDLEWVVEKSTRTHTNTGKVCDFVIDRADNGDYYLRPMDRYTSARRAIEVKICPTQ